MLNAFGLNTGGSSSAPQCAGAMGLTIINNSSAANSYFAMGGFSVSPMSRWRASSQWPATAGHFSRDFNNPTDRKVPMSVKQGFFPPIESANNSSPASVQKTNTLLRM